MDAATNTARTALEDEAVWGSPAFVERDQFVYFVTMAHELADPTDWPAFRDELVAALNAAWGLDTVWVELAPRAQARRTAERFQWAYALVDAVRRRHDPSTDWDGFFDALWAGRGPLREGL
jgi:hypothetical protein